MEFRSWRQASAAWRKSLNPEKPAGLWNQNLHGRLRMLSDAPLRTAGDCVSSAVVLVTERSSFRAARWSNARNHFIDACSRALGKRVSFGPNGLGAFRHGR